MGILEDSLDILIDGDELLGLLGKLLLHLIGVEEQVLEVSPVALHLRGHSKDLSDVRKGFGPSLNLRLKGSDEAGGLHG
jgi:hypothetical protein